MPLVTLVQEYPKEVLRIVCMALVSTVSTIMAVFGLSYAVHTMHIDTTTMLWVAILANIVALIAIPQFAKLSDRIGRKPVLIFGALAPAVVMFAYLWAISQMNIPLIFLFGILMSGLVYSAFNGVWPAFFAEMFDARVRLSGMAVGTQIGFALAGFTPTIAAAIIGDGPTAWVPVAVMTAVVCVIGAIAAATARETYNVPMDQLGNR